MKTTIICFALGLMLSRCAEAKLAINTSNPEKQASKVLLKATIRNTFHEPVESARVTLFLFDQEEKVIGRETRWVIGGGEKDKKPLEPGKETVYYFVINSDKPFARSEIRKLRGRSSLFTQQRWNVLNLSRIDKDFWHTRVLFPCPGKFASNIKEPFTT